MPQTADHPADLIIGRGLLTAETIRQELIDRLVRALAKRRYSPAEAIDEARDILWEFEPLLAHTLSDTEIAAWIAGADRVANRLPDKLFDKFHTSYPGDEWWKTPPEQYGWMRRPVIVPPVPPGLPPVASGADDEEPLVRFPMIEQAAESLFKRNVVTRDAYDQLTQDARNRAFTVAGETSTDALEKIRDTLGELTQEGTSLKQFKERMRGELEKSFLGPHHLENVFRTNTMAAFSEGSDRLADNPIVRAVLPYIEFFPIHDSRARDSHRAIEKQGLSGTGVFRADDPVWERITPPLEWNCRCARNWITIEKAAAKGVEEARRWIKTGQPPENPEWRDQFVDFQPPAGFSSRRRAA